MSDVRAELRRAFEQGGWTVGSDELAGIELEYATVHKFSTAKTRTYAYDPALGFAVHVKEVQP